MVFKERNSLRKSWKIASLKIRKIGASENPNQDSLTPRQTAKFSQMTWNFPKHPYQTSNLDRLCCSNWKIKKGFISIFHDNLNCLRGKKKKISPKNRNNKIFLLPSISMLKHYNRLYVELLGWNGMGEGWKLAL